MFFTKVKNFIYLYNPNLFLRYACTNISKLKLSRLCSIIRTKKLYLLMSFSILNFKDNITDEEFKQKLFEFYKVLCPNPIKQVKPNSFDEKEDWETILKDTNLKIFRKSHGEFYKYKVYGTFSDISSLAFYFSQVDINYRKTWDKYITEVEILYEDPKLHCEIIRWVTPYPYPMYSREYVYVRRHQIDYKNKMIGVMAKALTNPQSLRKNNENLILDENSISNSNAHSNDKMSNKIYESNPNYVRVTQYTSNLFIKPHNDDFEKPGFDFVLEYFDDPQCYFPNTLHSWFNKSGIQDYMERLHEASRNVQSHEDVLRNFMRNRSMDYTEKSDAQTPPSHINLSSLTNNSNTITMPKSGSMQKCGPDNSEHKEKIESSNATSSPRKNVELIESTTNNNSPILNSSSAAQALLINVAQKISQQSLLSYMDANTRSETSFIDN